MKRARKKNLSKAKFQFEKYDKLMCTLYGKDYSKLVSEFVALDFIKLHKKIFKPNIKIKYLIYDDHSMFDLFKSSRVYSKISKGNLPYDADWDNLNYAVSDIILNIDIYAHYPWTFLSTCRLNIQRAFNYERLSVESIDKLISTFNLKNKFVVELGAGKGYLSKALSDRGVAIKAFDDASWPVLLPHSFFDVKRMDSRKAAHANAHIVDYFIMSWVPYEDPVDMSVYKIVKAINPDCKVIYIGELGECCGTDISDIVESYHDIFKPYCQYIRNKVAVSL